MRRAYELEDKKLMNNCGELYDCLLDREDRLERGINTLEDRLMYIGACDVIRRQFGIKNIVALVPLVAHCCNGVPCEDAILVVEYDYQWNEECKNVIFSIKTDDKLGLTYIEF